MSSSARKCGSSRRGWARWFASSRGRKCFRPSKSCGKFRSNFAKTPTPKLLKAKERAINRLSVEEATAVAHAFSLFFHLVNLCEERERVRRLRAHERQGAGAPMSLRHTFSELRRQARSPCGGKKLLGSMHIEPVLTAHPDPGQTPQRFEPHPAFGE